MVAPATSNCQLAVVAKLSGRNTPEQELSVEVADVDSIEVDDMDVFEAEQGQVGKDLATQSACSNNQDLEVFTQTSLCLDDEHGTGFVSYSAVSST